MNDYISFLQNRINVAEEIAARNGWRTTEIMLTVQEADDLIGHIVHLQLELKHVHDALLVSQMLRQGEEDAKSKDPCQEQGKTEIQGSQDHDQVA